MRCPETQPRIYINRPALDSEDTLVKMEKEPVSKVEFKQMTDFKFKAACEAYSKLFDETEGSEERIELNKNISQLFNKEISYPVFYREISRYREDSGRRLRFRRVRIKGQRKRAYRRDQQKKNRIERHKR